MWDSKRHSDGMIACMHICTLKIFRTQLFGKWSENCTGIAKYKITVLSKFNSKNLVRIMKSDEPPN